MKVVLLNHPKQKFI